MSKTVDEHLEDSLNKVRTVFQKASARIEALKPGEERLPATQLAAELAAEFGMTGPQLYPVLLFMIKEYPGADVRKGAKGGIMKLKKEV